MMPSYLEHIYNLIIDKILKHKPSKVKRNLKRKQYEIIKELQCNTEIIIQKADKGSNTVIQDRSEYIKEAKSHQINKSV